LNFRSKNYKLIYPLIAFAAVIAFSRIYTGVHYPLDVVFGAIVGTISALLVLKIGDKFLEDKISHVCLKDKFIPKRNKKNI
jgi:undecaprenyl-diphosphatase